METSRTPWAVVYRRARVRAAGAVGASPGSAASEAAGAVGASSWRTSLTGWSLRPAGSQARWPPFSPKTAAKSMGGSGSAGVWAGSTQGATASESGRRRDVEKAEAAQSEGPASAVHTRTRQE